jgi:hypothetical protein
MRGRFDDMKPWALLWCACAAIVSSPWLAAAAWAQEVVPPPSTAPMTDEATAATITGSIVPSGTLIDIQLDEPVSSNTHRKGDWFALSLSGPVMLGDRIVVPAGTTGRGQVVHAAKAGWGGKGGELILAARYLEFEGRRIGLRGMKLGLRGKENDTLAMATAIAIGPIGALISGKNAVLPKGAPASAKLAEDLPAWAAIAADNGSKAVPADRAAHIEDGATHGAGKREGSEE